MAAAWRPHVAGAEPTGDEVHQFRAEERARQRVEELRQVTAWQTQEEIRKVAHRKYIPSLYVKRHTEDLLNYWLFTDETLSAELARRREAVHATLTATQERGRQRLDAIEAELLETRKEIRQFTSSTKAAGPAGARPGSDNVGEGHLLRGGSGLALPAVAGLPAGDDSRPAKGGRKRSADAARDKQLRDLRARQESLRKEKARASPKSSAGSSRPAPRWRASSNWPSPTAGPVTGVAAVFVTRKNIQFFNKNFRFLLSSHGYSELGLQFGIKGIYIASHAN